MIKSKDIHDLNHVKVILDDIKNYVSAYEEQIGELTESALENLTFQLCEIEEFIIGAQKYNSSNIANANIRMMIYWNYIAANCSFWDMIGELKQYEGDI